MIPVLFKIGPLTLHTYGLMMALGVGFALWFLYAQAKKQGLDTLRLIDAAFYTILISLVGAKLILLLSNFDYYVSYPGELLSLARSGGVFQGGLAFGVVFALWYFRRKKIPTWKTADIIGPALALGHFFGRLGCFAAGCCYGRACDAPWGVTFHSEYARNLTGIPLGQRLHPVQLYEAALNLLNFFVLFFVLRRKRFDGQVFALYIINYSVIRYFTEFFRGDHPDRAFLVRGASPFLSVSYPQLFCLLGLAAGILLGLLLKRRGRA
ncbi:MAG: prolipoprotein diacylglyceryl transferase [Candidatus Aminicenantes bacterium]|nr:prolipoprotein diacylglyceryl transferase [Candidatus Aminicenantes bacterium]